MSKAKRIARLKEIIRELIKKNLAEVSTTATAGIDGTGTGHYDTPKAFASGSQGGHPKPDVFGFTKVNEEVIKEYVSPDNFNKDFNTAMALVIKQANNLKGPLGKHPVKRNVNKLKAVQKLYMKFLAPAIKKADRNISKGIDLTQVKKRLSNGQFKTTLQYDIMSRIGGRSYDSNDFYGIEDKEKKLLDRIHGELRKLVNLMDDAQLENTNEAIDYKKDTPKSLKRSNFKTLDILVPKNRVSFVTKALKKGVPRIKINHEEVDSHTKDGLIVSNFKKDDINKIMTIADHAGSLFENVNEVTDKEINVIKKVVDNLKKLRQSFTKAMSIGDKELKNREYNKDYETILAAEKAMMAVVLKLKSKKMLGEGRYHDWRNDESMTPKQKVGKSMREIRDALNELDKTVKMNLKLKTELNMTSQDYWKNTHKALTKISERLVKMANKVGNLK